MLDKIEGAWQRMPLVRGTRIGTVIVGLGIIFALVSLAHAARAWGDEPAWIPQGHSLPVRPEPIKALVKWQERTVTRQVIVHDPPSKRDQKKIEDRFHLDLSHNDVLASAAVPRAGEVVVTQPKDGGAAEVTFKATPDPFFSLGGVREAGARYDALQQGGRVYYRQDLLRLGRAIFDGEVYAASYPRSGRTGLGAEIGVKVRF